MQMFFRNDLAMISQQYSYILLLKMQGKTERLLLSSTSKKVLRQLEENQSLRIELFRLRSDMRDQHHHFLNSIVNHQMLVEKMITELSLAYRRGREIRQQRGQNQTISGTIEHCIDDLESLLNSYGKLRGQWAKSKPQSSEIYYEKMLKDCSVRLDKAQDALEDLSTERDRINKENFMKITQIQQMQGEMGKLKQKYDQSMKEVSALKAENGKLSEVIANSQLKLNSYAEQVAKLKNSNDNLSNSLKQSREISNKHTEYLSSKCEGIQKQNKRLVELQREYQVKEQQWSKIAIQNENQIQRLREQKQRLTLEVQHLHLKFKEIIDKQNKIKHLESIKKKGEQRQALGQIPTNYTNANAQQRPFKKEVGKMINKKFNLQSFQEKLTTSTSSASFFPH